MNVRRWREKKTNKKMRKSPNIGFFLISHFSFPYSFPVCFRVVIVWCLISLMNSSRIYLRDYPLLISRFPTHFPVVSFEVEGMVLRFGDKLYGGLGAGLYAMVWRPVDNPRIHRSPHRSPHRSQHRSPHRSPHRSQHRTPHRSPHRTQHRSQHR